MSSTGNCSKTLSREHWLSRSVLEQMGPGNGKVRILGLPGARDEIKEVSINSLTAKILCERHNNALSSLDTAAGHAFSNITQAMSHVKNPGRARRRRRDYIIDGFAIELWALKVLLGVHFGGISAIEGGTTLSTLRFDTEKAIQHLLGLPLERPLGLYRLSTWFEGAAGSFQTLGCRGELAGLLLGLQEFALQFIFAIPNGPQEFNTAQALRHPAIIEIAADHATSFLFFCLAGNGSGRQCHQGTLAASVSLTACTVSLLDGPPVHPWSRVALSDVSQGTSCRCGRRRLPLSFGFYQGHCHDDPRSENRPHRHHRHQAAPLSASPDDG
jgi:hypothetical protein